MADAMDSMSKSMAEPEIELSDSLSYLTRRSLSGAAEEEEEEEEENEPETVIGRRVVSGNQTANRGDRAWA